MNEIKMQLTGDTTKLYRDSGSYITSETSVTRVLTLPRSVLDLDKTLNCGQTFLWQKVDDAWYGFIMNSLVKLSQIDNEVTVTGNISELAFNHYFDLHTKYEFTRLSEFEKKCVTAGQGIRILRQPFLECLITFMISQNNNMTRIRSSLTALCEKYGTWIQLGDHAQYLFPALAELFKLSLDDWKQLGVGYRANYLYGLFHEPSLDRELFLDYLLGSATTYLESMQNLKKIKGVGPKVAACVALFSFHHLNAFPIDTHIMKILKEHRDITLPRPDGLDGVMQQYMFYYDAFNKGEVS